MITGTDRDLEMIIYKLICIIFAFDTDETITLSNARQAPEIIYL